MSDYQKLEQDLAEDDKLTEEEEKVLKNSDTEYVSPEHILKMCRRFRNQIEAVREPNISKSWLLLETDQGRDIDYNLYLFQFSSESAILELRKALLGLYEQLPFLRTMFFDGLGKWVKIVVKERSVCVPICDFSEEEEEKKVIMIANIIASEQRKKYVPNKRYPLYMNILKKREEEYLCLLSICERMDCLHQRKKILDTLFHVQEAEKLQYLVKGEKAGFIKTVGYWRSVLTLSKGYVPAQITEKKRTFGNAVFTLDKELEKMMDEFSKEYNISLKSILFLVWGIMLCKHYQCQEIIMGDMHENAKMQQVPVKVTRQDDFKIMLQDIQKQLKNMNSYNNCSLEDLEVSLGFPIREKISVVHNFFDVPEIKEIFASIEKNKIYQMEQFREDHNVPLMISYNWFSENKRIHYYYDLEEFENIDIEEIHNKVFQTLKDILLSVKNEQSYDSVFKEQKLETKLNDKELEIVKKVRYLKKTSVFSSLLLEELMQLANQCKVLDFFSEDGVIDVQTNVNSLYLIAEGKVVESGMDRNNVVKTLQILKEGDVFGIECIRKNTSSENSYVVYSDIAKIVEIPVKVLWEEIMKRPQIMQEFLEIQSKKVHKYQTLWMQE